MSLIYIPVGSIETADRLSRGVYQISRPPGHRPASYGTTHAFGWLVHPETGAVVLALDPAQTVPCHVAADPSGLLAIIAGEATEAELLALQALVDGLKAQGGGTVPLGALVPSALAQQALTYEQLQAEGWFPEIVG